MRGASPQPGLSAWTALFFSSALLITAVVSYLAPIRGINPFSDLGIYESIYNNFSLIDVPGLMLRYEPGFVLLTWFCSHVMDFSTFLRLVDLVILWSFFLLLLRYCGREWFCGLVALLFFFLFPPFHSISAVVIRQGVATIFFFRFLARDGFAEYRARGTYVFVALMLLFHYSSIFALLAVALEGATWRWPRFAFQAWLLLTVGYVLGITGEIGKHMYEMAGLNVATLEAMNENADLVYTVGFKPGFLLVSTFFVLLPRLLIFLRVSHADPRTLYSQRIFRVYFMINGLATLTAMMPYHDRFFLWSWVMGAALIVVPLRAGQTSGEGRA